MANEELIKLVSVMREDADLQIQFMAPEVMKDALSFTIKARELGYNIDQDDVVKFVMEGGIAGFLDLSDEDLALIAGGTRIDECNIMHPLMSIL